MKLVREPKSHTVARLAEVYVLRLYGFRVARMMNSAGAMGRLDSIDDLRLFEAIVRTGSLSAAAHSLDVSLTVVSKRLRRLEAALGVRLAHRTTRQLQLTMEGQRFQERCRTVLEAVDAAEEIGEAGTGEGIVRVTAAVAFTQRQIAPRLPRFLAAHPGISVQVVSSNDLLDLVARRIDVALRQSSLADSRLITRPLVPDSQILCAAPEYLARFGAPATPAELVRHTCLTVGDPPPSHWTLCRGDAVVEVPVSSTVCATDGEVCHIVAQAGGGIAMKAAWDVASDIRAGRLVRVLPEWWGGRDRWVRLVYPARRHRPHRVGAFIAFLEAEMRAALAQNAELGLFEATDSGEIRSSTVQGRRTPG